MEYIIAGLVAMVIVVPVTIAAWSAAGSSFGLMTFFVFGGVFVGLIFRDIYKKDRAKAKPPASSDGPGA